MRTFSITTLGCKINQYESQQFRELLEGFGLKQVEAAEGSAELVVVNTCCVTHIASAKSRQYIRRAQRQNPEAIVVACGCLANVEIGEINHLGENIRLISHRGDFSTLLSKIVSDKTASGCQSAQPQQDSIVKADTMAQIKPKSDLSLPGLSCFKGYTRAFIKVQGGCDGYCSYCIIPKTRPIVRSRDPESILAEAQRLVAAGHKEIVVTGIFLGAYGQETVLRSRWAHQRNDKLADLLDKMAEISGLVRIRLSSLEPADITDGLLDAFCRNRNIMPHIHLSLQSGSDSVLEKMRRQYSVGEFRDKVGLIKSRLDRPAITADLIVGFPGETDADFAQTVGLAREVGFAKMHVFAFSARKGTAAAKMQHVVNNRVIKERSKILRELDEQLGCKFRQQFVGEGAEVLLEKADGEVCGRVERYFMVSLEKGDGNREKNEIVRVKLIQNSEKEIVGRVLNGG